VLKSSNVFGKVRKGIGLVLADTDRKSLLGIFMDVVRCLVTEKEVRYYFYNLLYKQGVTGLENYVSLRESRLLRDHVLLPNGTRNSFIRNKLLFNLYMEERGIDVPKVVGYNTGTFLVSNNNTFYINNVDDLMEALKSMSCESGMKSFFVKPVDGSQGRQCFKLDLERTPYDRLASIHRELMTGEFIFQELLDQHPRVSDIYSGSINTIRIYTIRRPNNQPRIISARMRFGAFGSVVDNASAGGFVVPVDHEKWCLEKHGVTQFKHGGLVYTKHPDTGFVFENFIIPLGKEAGELCLSAARFFRNQIIGWDIAITKKGPIVLEANDNPCLVGAQISCGGFRKHPEWRAIFQELNS